MQLAQTTKNNIEDDSTEVDIKTVYEVGYNILPIVEEGEVEGVVSRFRDTIEKAGGVFVSEGASQKIQLSYPMAVWANGKWTNYTEAFFGWIKFELSPNQLSDVEAMFKSDASVLRFLLIKTVREDTRANVRQFVLKEVKRTDTIKSAPRTRSTSETKEAVSDEKLDEAIEGLVAD